LVVSSIVSAIHSIERELKLGVRDPVKKRRLLLRLLQLQKDAGSMGYSPEELKTGEIVSGNTSHKEIQSQSKYIPTPEAWNKEQELRNKPSPLIDARVLFSGKKRNARQDSLGSPKTSPRNPYPPKI
jgi:hypothetical protein